MTAITKLCNTTSKKYNNPEQLIFIVRFTGIPWCFCEIYGPITMEFLRKNDIVLL